jgi:hypothetical protein
MSLTGGGEAGFQPKRLLPDKKKFKKLGKLIGST